jgi:hypothetical protein
MASAFARMLHLAVLRPRTMVLYCVCRDTLGLSAGCLHKRPWSRAGLLGKCCFVLLDTRPPSCGWTEGLERFADWSLYVWETEAQRALVFL